jgi:hypothetical protein
MPRIPHRTPKQRVKPLIAAIAIIRDYLRDGKGHPQITKWEWHKACRMLGVSSRHGPWLMRCLWNSRLREYGFNPETLEVIDEFRNEVWFEMMADPQWSWRWTITEFRRRLTLARLEQNEPQAYKPAESEEPSAGRSFLERCGIELE